MGRIFVAALLLVAAVFAGILLGRAPGPEPRLDHASPLFKKPGLMSRRRHGSGASGGVAVWRIVQGIDDGNDTQHDNLQAIA